jgi:hypothetical protein
MENSFKHYLITRFNLRKKEWTLSKNNESVLTDDWMEHRMGLFKNFCLPSVANQSCKRFQWLIFFDINTDSRFKQEIEILLKPFAHFQGFFVDGMEAFRPAVQDLIEKDSQETPYIITSRIDNDDCIHRDFIKTIQKQFNFQDFMAVDILKGYTLQISPSIMLGKKEHIYNPFISLIEKNNSPKTVWFSDHNMWKKESRRIEVSHKRLWMSIIHEKNKVNEFDGYDAVAWDDIRTDFCLSGSMDHKIALEVIPHKNWQFLSFKNKCYINYVLMSKKLKKTIGLYKLK